MRYPSAQGCLSVKKFILSFSIASASSWASLPLKCKTESPEVSFALKGDRTAFLTVGSLNCSLRLSNWVDHRKGLSAVEIFYWEPISKSCALIAPKDNLASEIILTVRGKTATLYWLKHRQSQACKDFSLDPTSLNALFRSR